MTNYTNILLNMENNTSDSDEDESSSIVLTLKIIERRYYRE